MRYSLLVTAGPRRPAAVSALHTARALYDAGHALHRVFLYREGVELARDSGGESPGAELTADWSGFLRETAVDGVACSATAERAGIREPAEGTGNLQGPWRLAGLGEWVEALASSDRILQFGP